MVLTQLQLKWPNHSTHLLTRLTYLFKNEQLVDCTLMCNKHSLKVHRSVLAACSPYFERELQNNPSIVVKDMQFSVLKALIEFMYYGETRITEENLTSLIEAAKIFEVKGLSEMDIVSGKNGIVSSVVALDNDCIVESSCLSDDIDKATTILQQSLAHSTVATSASMLDNNPCSTTITTSTTGTQISTNPSNMQHLNHCGGNDDDGRPMYESAAETDNNNIMVESTSNNSMPYDDHPQGPHSSRNFVVTPPQTESAQILLSLARSHNQKLFSSHIDEDGNLTNGVDDEIHDTNDSGFLNHDDRHHQEQQQQQQQCSSRQGNEDGCNNIEVMGFDRQQQQQQHQHQHQQLQQHSINNSSILFGEQHNLIINDTSNGVGLISMAGATVSGSDHRRDDVETEPSASPVSGKSLLAKLLTRDNGEIEQIEQPTLLARLLTRNNHEIEAKSTAVYEVAKDDGKTTLTAADLQPSIILECPFLIETTDGAYVDVCVENMLNSLNGDTGVATSVEESASIVSEEPAVYELPSLATISLANPAVLDRIKHDPAPELENDPEAVVLTKISEDGRVEKYVLSSADIQALKQMNERLAAANVSSRTSSAADIATEIETPGNPVITRIMVDGTGGIQNAINRLPFKKTVVGSGSVAGAGSGQPDSSSGLHHPMLDDPLAVVGAHHHENMFEELDNQFNTMDCCAIDDEEHIRRDYVAYEEASKNETQLEHNYYANAMKDEDEEPGVITDQYDLGMMMMIEDPARTNDTSGGVQQTITSTTKPSPSSKKRYQPVQLLGATGSPDICLNGVVPLGTPKSTSTALRINGNVTDKSIAVVPANGNGGAGKCDLIINDALMSSVLNVVPAPALVKTIPVPATTKRKSSQDNVLPFRSVKSANTFRNSTNAAKKSSSASATKRTYKRKANASNQTQQRKMVAPLNGGFSNENNLIEEIIVDEIS